MKTIELTDKEYVDLLAFKNFVSLKTRQVTNKVVWVKSGKKEMAVNTKLSREVDFEPEFRFGECISQTIKSVMDEQKTGEVNYIT